MHTGAMAVSVPVAAVPVFCTGHAVCAVELCVAVVDLAQCLLPGLTRAALVVVPVTAVPPVSLPACAVRVSNTPGMCNPMLSHGVPRDVPEECRVPRVPSVLTIALSAFVPRSYASPGLCS